MKTKITAFLHRNRRTIFVIALLAAAAFLVIPHLAMAADAAPQPVSSPEIDKMYRDITRFVTFILEFLQRLLWPVMLLIGGLMKNDILFGGGMEERMLAIWVQIRNLVNILFVLFLLGIAFYNVVGGPKQEYQLKQALPKFIIGLIAVNFSFIAVKLLIDTVNVASTAVFALPNAVQDGLGKMPKDESGEFDKTFTQMICEGIYGDDTVYAKNIKSAEDELKKNNQEPMCTAGKGFTGTAKQFFANYDAHNAGIIMAVNLSKITDWGKVNPGISDFKGLALNSLFGVALFIVFATSYVALFVVLLIRLIVLWVTLVLSPLIVLTYVLPEGLAGTVGGGELKKKFMQNIIAPLPISLMMTIGYMMMQGMKDTKFTELSNVSLSTTSVSMGLFTSGLSTLQELIIAVGTISVIWMGVFQAAKTGFAEKIVGQIEEGVKGVGKFAAESIKYAPIFPVKGAQGEDGKELKMSMAGALNMGSALEAGRRDQVMKETQAAMKGFDMAKARTYGDDIRNATTPDGFLQKVANAKNAHVEHDAYIQKNMASAARKIPGMEQKLKVAVEVSKMKDTNGKDITNYQQLLTALEAGTVEADSMRRFVARSTENITPEPEKKPEDAAKTAGGSSKDKHDQARSLITAGGANEQMLEGNQKKAVQDYRAAMNTKDEKKQEDALKALQDSKALDALQGVEAKRLDFIQQAEGAKDATALNGLIAKRKKELTDAGVTDVNGTLRSDLESVIKNNSAVMEEAKKNADTAAIVAATPAKAAEVKEYTPPAAGKAKGGGGGGGGGGKAKSGNDKKGGNNSPPAAGSSGPPQRSGSYDGEQDGNYRWNGSAWEQFQSG